MYTVIYIYRVRRESIPLFLDIHDRANEIYLASGALERTVYHADDLNNRHGYKSLLDFIRLRKNEQVFLSQMVYRNKSHYEDVMELIDNSIKMNQLNESLTKIVDFSRGFTASFTTKD